MVLKKILILGGGGFIGGHLAKHFKSQGHWVRVVDIKEHEYFNHEEGMFVRDIPVNSNELSLNNIYNSFVSVNYYQSYLSIT
jgi:nucleoside-diphosphate-sugar epimerase